MSYLSSYLHKRTNPESTGSLKGYRIGIVRRNASVCRPTLAPESSEYLLSLLQEEGSDVLRIFEAPESDREAFLAWWAGELDRAVRDGVRIVVVGDLTYDCHCHREWLQTIEEEEWYDNDEGSFRFTTLQSLFEAMESGGSLTDDWGETIETMSINGADGSRASRERDVADVVPIAEEIRCLD